MTERAHMCVRMRVCVCVCVRERERERESGSICTLMSIRIFCDNLQILGTQVLCLVG